jgi:hypothetical protein
MNNFISSFQKLIMSPLFVLNSSMFFIMVPYKFYYNINNLNFDHVNVQYGFTF